MPSGITTFPEGFLWGTATAADGLRLEGGELILVR